MGSRYQDSPDVLRNLAAIYIKEKREDDAVRCLERMIEVSPDYSTYNRLANFYKIRETWTGGGQTLDKFLTVDAYPLSMAASAKCWRGI